jgi:hypothetical protein
MVVGFTTTYEIGTYHPFGPLDSISSVLDFPLICLALWWLTPLSIVQLYRGENLRPVASH